MLSARPFSRLVRLAATTLQIHFAAFTVFDFRTGTERKKEVHEIINSARERRKKYKHGRVSVDSKCDKNEWCVFVYVSVSSIFLFSFSLFRLCNEQICQLKYFFFFQPKFERVIVDECYIANIVVQNLLVKFWVSWLLFSDLKHMRIETPLKN